MEEDKSNLVPFLLASGLFCTIGGVIAILIGNTHWPVLFLGTLISYGMARCWREE